jgi:hypothetical protein
MWNVLGVQPDDGHIGLKHVVRKKTADCEYVKVTGTYITDKAKMTGAHSELYNIEFYNIISQKMNSHYYLSHIEIYSVISHSQSVNSTILSYTK